jgi:hypothetical protein
MRVNLKVRTKIEYFSQTEREIDWEEKDDTTKISIKQANELQKILATEVSIFLLRRSIVCESLVDTMVSIRRELIKKYENEYETYIEYNDFYN